MKIKKPTNNFILIVTILSLFLITTLTQFYGTGDIGDYVDVARFFAEEYQAKIRSSHSYFYGFTLSPFAKITNGFLGMKIISLIWLILLILSIYYISGKDRKTLLLTVTAPIFWYMAPGISPIPIASLFFLWGIYFLKKYDSEEKIKNLFYSGVFFGLAWVFWDTVLHLLILLTLCVFWNKKFYHLIYFMFFILIGLIPRLILDQFLFNFPFFTILKSFTGGLVNSFWSGSLGSGHSPKTFSNIISTIIVFPLFSYLLLKPKNFKKNKKINVFLILAFLMILSNPQPRYTLILIPIILLHLKDLLNKKQLKKYLIFSIIISILVVIPYVIQIKYSTNYQEFNSILDNLNELQILENNPETIIQKDLKQISKDFLNQRFVVGPLTDDYAILTRLYTGKEIKEFVSIQDYDFYLKNQTILFEKEFHPIPNLNNRREIWIKGGISRRTNDATDYENITFAIGMNEQFSLQEFKILQKYDSLVVLEKE